MNKHAESARRREKEKTHLVIKETQQKADTVVTDTFVASQARADGRSRDRALHAMTYAEGEVAFIRLGRNENDRQGKRFDSSGVAVFVFGRRSERQGRVNCRDDFGHRIRFGRIRRTERPESSDEVLERLRKACQGQRTGYLGRTTGESANSRRAIAPDFRRRQTAPSRSGARRRSPRYPRGASRRLVR